MGNFSGRISSQRLIIYAALAVIAVGILYFFKLGSFPLLDRNEPVYGQVAREMAHGSGWLTPHFLGSLWFDKPPLFYWLSGFMSVLLGATELAARLPSALLAVGLLALVYALTAYDFGRRAGLLAALVMATCLMQIYLAHGAVTDMTLVFCLTGALYAFRRWLDAQGRAGYGWAALCGVMTGFGMMTKGPVAPFLLSVTMLAYLAWSKQLPRLKRLDTVIAVGAALLVGLPWYLAMYHLHKAEFVEGFLMANNITRFTTAEHAGQTGQWYSIFNNIPTLIGLFFPWSMFLPQAIGQRFWREHEGARLALTWAAVVFVFFSISKTILITYIFPLFPAAALLVGALWMKTSEHDDRVARGVRGGLIAGAVFAVLIAVFLQYYAAKEFPQMVSATLVLGGILLATMLAALVWGYTRRERLTAAAGIIGVGMVCFTFWLLVSLIPLCGKLSQKDLVAQLPAVSRGRIIAYNLPSSRRGSLYYYGNARPGYSVQYLGDPVERLGLQLEVPVVDKAQEAETVRRLLAEPIPTFIVGGDSEEFRAFLKLPNAHRWNYTGDFSIIANTAAFTEKGLPLP